MAFNWEAFLTDHRIDYKHTSRGQIAVHCPFCGSQDASTHMSVSTEGRGWRCWRSPSDHSGVSPVRLIVELIGCSVDAARAIAGVGGRELPNDLVSKVRQLLDEHVPSPVADVDVEFPPEFRKDWRSPFGAPYAHYLRSRGFTIADAEEWGLKFATRGDYQGRIIFPIYHNGELRSWTGRAVGRSALRYKELEADYAGASAKDFLLWLDRLTGGDVLVLVEGPFDAFKVNVLGAAHRIASTCFMTIEPSRPQLERLYDVMSLYDRVVILLDRGAYAKAIKLQSKFVPRRVDVVSLPSDRKDPAELRTDAELLDTLTIQRV